MLTLGSFFVASHLHERLLTKYKIQLIDSNLIVKLLIAMFGSVVVSIYPLLHGSYEIQILGAILGTGMGYAIFNVELYLVKTSNDSVYFAPKDKPIINIKNSNTIINDNLTYLPYVMVAVLEEIIFRGYLTTIALNLSNFSLSLLALISIILVFAFNHINLGIISVITKFLLGIVCLLSFLITHTILTPVFIHVTFNILVISEYRKLNHV